MQAPVSLPDQRSTLEGIYVFLKGLEVFLEVAHPTLTAEDRLSAENLLELAALCEHRLIETFPELLQWLADWTRGDVA
jgi:hypothetical protein